MCVCLYVGVCVNNLTVPFPYPFQLGVDGVFVGSGIFKGENPARRAAAMVKACAHYKNPAMVAEVMTRNVRVSLNPICGVVLVVCLCVRLVSLLHLPFQPAAMVKAPTTRTPLWSLR